ncbi:UNVERIFIED_CONTAM: 40S ribosomal protein SA [Sesamum radiatum]|uniref:40S ribosomal protein SA n=1 Tax=Sesamum radiatum TaxID=300843 RepID=A0AAW2RYR6_SESRA
MATAQRVLSTKESDIRMMLASEVHLGTKNCDFQMERYVFKRRNDGNYTCCRLNLRNGVRLTLLMRSSVFFFRVSLRIVETMGKLIVLCYVSEEFGVV